MWKIIGTPLLIYLIFVFYIYQPSPEGDIPIAELIKQMPPDVVEVYIQNHVDIAVKEMHRAQIPASIILAQAILESKYGTSELATKANNHFGIKAGTEWGKGNRHCLYSNEWDKASEKMTAVLSCFVQYSKVEESYIGHSDFLAYRPYYTALFELNTKDYKAWAIGLQKAGYATDPRYSDKLIAIIERYELFEYDSRPQETT